MNSKAPANIIAGSSTATDTVHNNNSNLVPGADHKMRGILVTENSIPKVIPLPFRENPSKPNVISQAGTNIGDNSNPKENIVSNNQFKTFVFVSRTRAAQIHNPKTKVLTAPNNISQPSTSTGVVHVETPKPVTVDKLDPKKVYTFTEEELQLDVELEISKLLHKDIFHRLTEIFDQVRREYILKLCMKYEKLLNTEKILSILASVLLTMGSSYPKIDDLDKEQKVQLQDTYNNLLEIFPDADPEYLKQKAQDLADKPENLQQFVQEILLNKNYPTKEQYLKQQKLKKQLEQYINNFDVKQFLEMLPNPVQFFENPERQSDKTMVEQYLRNHYNQIRVNTIKKTLSETKYNLTLSVKILDEIKTDMKSKRQMEKHRVDTENILFAQEIAFIRHRKEIEDYLKSIKEQEKIEYETLKQQGGLLQCECCYNDECIPSKTSCCEQGHVFCNTCIIQGIESVMADGSTHVSCFVSCEAEFSLTVLQSVLKPAQFSILLTKRQDAEIRAAGLEGLVSCPFCHFASIPPAEDKVFKCLNQECMKESCRFCKELNHLPQTCEEAKSDMASEKAVNYLAEKMTEALIRICYKCKKPFFKEEGCNKMTCPCGATMCYICEQPVEGYKHFRGQGSDVFELCPLYTDDAHMNAAVVQRIAKAAAQELKAKNPNLKLEVEKLMPDLPAPKTIGAHNQILRPMDLPEHALRARPYAENRPQ